MNNHADRKGSGKRVGFLLSAFHGGGGERVVLELARGLLLEEIPVDIVVLERKGAFLKEVPQHVHIVDLQARRILRALVPLVHYLRYTKPDIVVATGMHTNVLLSLAHLFASKKIKIILRVGIPPSIIFDHYKGIKDRFFMPMLVKFLYPRVQGIVAVSHGIAEDLKKTLRFGAGKVMVIYNPIPLEELERKAQKPSDHSWFFNKKIPVVLAAGRLRYQKGFDILIKAISFVNQKQPVRLIVLGGGSELGALESRAQTLGVGEMVDFVGFVENPYAYMARADIFVLSSRWEGFPNVLVEAMAVGTPVVATDCPYGPREILAPGTNDHMLTKPEQAKHGILVAPEDAISLSEALLSLLGDRALQEHYRKQGYIRVQDFSSASIIPKYKALFGV